MRALFSPLHNSKSVCYIYKCVTIEFVITVKLCKIILRIFLGTLQNIVTFENSQYPCSYLKIYCIILEKVIIKFINFLTYFFIPHEEKNRIMLKSFYKHIFIKPRRVQFDVVRILENSTVATIVVNILKAVWRFAAR